MTTRRLTPIVDSLQAVAAELHVTFDELLIMLATAAAVNMQPPAPPVSFTVEDEPPAPPPFIGLFDRKD